MSDPTKPNRNASTDDLEAFEQRLNAKRAVREGAEQQKAAKEADRSGMAVGLRYGAEFAAGVLIGAGLGYMVDLATGAPPWGLLVGALLGFAAGVRNITRAAAELNAKGSTPKADED